MNPPRLNSLALAALLVSGPASSVAAQTVTELQVAPATVELAVGQREGVLATAFGPGGSVLSGAPLVWSSTDDRVVQVEQDEAVPNLVYLVGVAPGIASVNVSAGSVVATATVRVSGEGGTGAVASDLPPATALRIEPMTVFLLPTEEVRLSPRFVAADGSPGAPTVLNWRSLLESVAAVSEQGVIIGIAPGQGVVETSTSSGLTARAVVHVQNAALGFSREVLALSPAESDTLSVVVPSQDNRTVASRQLQWSSANRQVVVISPSGVATAIAPGSAEIVATGFGQQHRLPVRVHRPVEAMFATPPQGEIPIPLEGSVEFEAQLADANDRPVPEAPVFWVIEDSTIATFDLSTSRVTGKRVGTTRLTARGPGEGLQAAWTLSVVAGGLVLSQTQLGLDVSERVRVTASVTDDTGAILAEANAVTWTSSDPTVVGVDPSGTVSGVGWGHAQVIATTAWGGVDTVDAYVQGRLLVTSTRSGDGDIYALDPESPSALNRVSDAAGAEVSGNFSPDGTRIAYISTGDGNPELYVMNADGSDPRRLTTTESAEASPQWTPDGRQIIYAVVEGRSTQVWAANADGSEARVLNVAGGGNDQPAVSPDGNMIAFRSVERGGRDIFLMNVDGSNVRPFTETETREGNPAWFPDGRLAYLSEQREDRRSVTRVLRADLTTGATEVVTPPGLSVADFAVSSDGNLLALIVQAIEEGVMLSKLYLMPLTGAQAGTPIEVPRALAAEQFIEPAFKP
jgi:TolB protein